MKQVTRKDQLPEHASFKDSGCRYSPSCLECPLPVCKHDQPASLMDQVKRDARIFQLRQSGVPYKKIMRAYGVSTRHIDRVMQRGGPSPRALEQMNEGVNKSPLSLPKTHIQQRKPWPQLMRRVS